MTDKVKLVLFSILCAVLAWLFWYMAGPAGFYILGVCLLLSIALRAYRKCSNNRKHQ